MDGDSNNETNFPDKSLLTNTQVSKLCKAFPNGPPTNIKSSTTQLFKIVQSGGFFGSLLGPLLKSGFPLIGKVLKLLAKSVSIPLGLTAAAVATDAAIHDNILRLGMATLIISNEVMNDTMKIVESLEESGLLIKCVSKTIKK